MPEMASRIYEELTPKIPLYFSNERDGRGSQMMVMPIKDQTTFEVIIRSLRYSLIHGTKPLIYLDDLEFPNFRNPSGLQLEVKKAFEDLVEPFSGLAIHKALYAKYQAMARSEVESN